MSTSAISAEAADRSYTWPHALLLIGRIALGVVFLVAAYTKFHFSDAWHFGDYYFFFGMAIDSYHLLPFWAVNLLSRGLPVFELFLGAWLMIGVGLRWAGIVSCLLLGVFISAMTHAYLQGQTIACGCFGNAEKLGPVTLLRDGSLLVLALAVTVGAFLIPKRIVKVLI